MKRIREIVSPLKTPSSKRNNSQKTPTKPTRLKEEKPHTSRTTLFKDNSQTRSRSETSGGPKKNNNTEMDSQQFTKFFIDAMNNEEGANAMRKVIAPLIAKQEEQIKSLTDKVKNQQEQMDRMENELEMLKQQTKKKTMVISGLEVKDDEDPEQIAMQLCKDKLKVNLHPVDIDSVSKVKTKTGNRTDILLTVTTLRKKSDIMRAKKKLKGFEQQIYINESLTPKQGELFAESRKLTKNGSINSAWTRDGKIYIKEKRD